MFKQIKDSGIPLLFVFSENDALLSRNEFSEFSKLLGANQMNAYLYDKEGNIVKSGELKLFNLFQLKFNFFLNSSY